AGGVDRIGVATRQAGQGRAAVEPAGVEEVRAGAPGFQRELAETQCLRLDGKPEESGSVVGHGRVRVREVAPAAIEGWMKGNDRAPPRQPARVAGPLL